MLEQFEIEVPPLPEQRAIYALSQSLDERRSSCEVHLRGADESLRRFRQSVLAAACSGRLTADWRESSGLDPEVSDRLVAALRLSADPRRRKHSAADVESAADGFPREWRMASGADVFTFVTSGSRGWAKFYSESGPLFLRVGNLDHDSLDLDLRDVQHVDPSDSAEAVRTRVRSDDLLISITADVGMVGVVPSHLIDAYVNQHIAIARPHPTLNSRFLAVFVAAPNGGQKQLGALQRGATKAGLGLDDIRSLSIPVPPREEQDEIAQRVDRLFGAADELTRRIDKCGRQVGRISQAVLSQAFRGDFILTGGSVNHTPASGRRKPLGSDSTKKSGRGNASRRRN